MSEFDRLSNDELFAACEERLASLKRAAQGRRNRDRFGRMLSDLWEGLMVVAGRYASAESWIQDGGRSGSDLDEELRSDRNLYDRDVVDDWNAARRLDSVLEDEDDERTDDAGMDPVSAGMRSIDGDVEPRQVAVAVALCSVGESRLDSRPISLSELLEGNVSDEEDAAATALELSVRDLRVSFASELLKYFVAGSSSLETVRDRIVTLGRVACPVEMLKLGLSYADLGRRAGKTRASWQASGRKQERQFQDMGVKGFKGPGSRGEEHRDRCRSAQMGNDHRRRSALRQAAGEN